MRHVRVERLARESQERRSAFGIEHKVSRHIGAMPFLWLSVSGRADRGYLESNSIALLLVIQKQLNCCSG